MASSEFRCDLCLWILLKMVCSARVVLELGRKAYCVGEMMLLVHHLVVDEGVEYFGDDREE